MLVVLAALLVLALPRSCWAQFTFTNNNGAITITGYTGPGGDVTIPSIAGSLYAVSGTIGQPDTSLAMTGGNYSVTGGFWSLISVVQTAGLPNLTITHSGNTVTVSWPNTVSCTNLNRRNPQ